MSGVLPVVVKLTEQVPTGSFYSDGFCMVGSDGTYQGRPATPITRAANRDGAEAADIIRELYEALEALANDVGAMRADLPNHGSTLGSLIEARTALARARGDQ